MEHDLSLDTVDHGGTGLHRGPRGLCGKLVVATSEAQVAQLRVLEAKARRMGDFPDVVPLAH